MVKNSTLVAIILGAIILGYIAWYLISPAFITIEANEPSPLDTANEGTEMSSEEKEAFDNAVEEMENDTIEMQEPMPIAAQLISQGSFVAKAHDVAGKALLIETAEGNILRFEDFETINGPNLHIYLSANLDDTDYVDLGEL
ncbi:hypothetical protein GF342_05685, partial [Candidatus Woesearchaeota archaeon]|nr:hypothetical protein [Candidatus Woesearchaeota archaeon]